MIATCCGLLFAFSSSAQCGFNPSINSITNTSCNGGSNGAIDLNVSGGPVPFSFVWSNGATTEDISGLTAGAYSVTISDAVGCTMTFSGTVTQPAATMVTAQNLLLTCINPSGNVPVSVTGGTSPYSWALSNGASGVSASSQFNISQINTPGNYTVTVTDANGCTGTDQFDVFVDIAAPIANAGPDFTLTCAITSLTLNGAGSSTGPMFTYLWIGPGITGGQITLFPTINQPGVYTLIVTNTQNGCTATDQVVVTGNFIPPLITVLSQIGIPCGGGLITLPVSVSGAPNTAFLWSGPNNFNSTVETPTTTEAGLYSLVATNTTNGCTASAQLTVYPGPAIPLQNFSITDLSCVPGSKGNIDLNPNFGTAPYTFSWSNGASTEDISNLNAGTYTVTVTDAASCAFQAFVVVKQIPSSMVLSTVIAPALCFGGNSGSIDLTVTGGTAPYVYSWTNGATTQDVNNLTVGTYTVTVTDASGCTKTNSSTITQAAAISIATSITHVLCNGASTGAITLTVSGGVPPYTYNWSNGATTQNLINVAAGTYTVTVTDLHNCTKTISSTAIQLLPIVSSIIVTNVSCFGSSTGSVDLTVSGGTPPYAYAWAGPQGYTSTVQDPVGLAAGIYMVTITDANGCTRTIQATVASPQPMAIPNNNIVLTNITCFGGSNGAISINPTGGTPPYTYDWSNDGPEDPDNDAKDLTGVGAGTYTVTVTDSRGCSLTFPAIFIAQPAQMAPVTTTDPIPCGTPNPSGTIDLAPIGGTPPYGYIWSNGATTQSQGGLPPGAYSVTVTDVNGCTGASTSTIFVGEYILPGDFTITPASCQPGASDGAISLNVLPVNASAPLVFNWQGPAGFSASTQDISGLGVGSYSLTITDASDCQFIATLAVGNLPGSFSVAINPGASSCTSASTDVTVTNGSAPFTYLWSNGATTKNIATSISGTYTITVTDATGCTKTANTTISIAPPISMASNFTGLFCAGGSNAAINITVAGGTPPYTYLWNNGATTQNLFNLPSGTYCVTVTDAVNCTVAQCFTIAPGPQFAATMAPTAPTCAGAGDGSLLVALNSGNTGPFTWNLVGPAMQNGSSPSNSFTINGLSSGTYCITVTNALGCTAIACAPLGSPSPILADLTELSNTCDAAAIQANVSGGVPPYTFSWANSAPLPNVTQTIIANTSDNYHVTVTDANGCTKVATINVTLANGGACGYVRGSVVQDDNKNCMVDLGEPGLSGWLIRAEGLDTLYGITGANGKYLVAVPAGAYKMAVLAPNGLWQVCPLALLANVAMQNDTAFGGDFPVKAEVLCPALSVSIGTQQLRRCFSTNYYNVSYCNDGTALAENAYIEVLFDPFITFVSSAIPSQSIGLNKRRFFIGNVGIGDCNNFSIRVSVNCSAVLGQTHCTEAHIFPDTLCIDNAQWTGASLAVRSVCNNDSIQFIIKNVGSGNMGTVTNYIVVEDAVMLMQAPMPLLGAGDSITLKFPANGSTWRVEVGQEAFHPYPQPAGLSVEGCTTSSSFSTGFVNQFPISDYSESIDIDCTANIGSYDPNDKQGYPIGYGAAHYVRPGTEIEYLIRFQNTGTDTAFTVRIIDTLSVWLDPASVKFGASSHLYRYDLCGEGIVHFIFEDIMLPDSNVNEAASHGFVKFKATPRSDALLESVIENTAAIYFDFNDPVITNTTFHRLGENFVTVGLWQPRIPHAQVSASPNPFGEETLLEVKGLQSQRPLQLQVFDFQGKAIRSMESDDSMFRLKKVDWPAGVYFFKITQQGKTVGSGKLIVQ